jgi:signal transduction histidine kinase/CheY-like chemotaxis protein
MGVEAMSQLLLGNILKVSHGHYGYIIFVTCPETKKMKYIAEVGLKSNIKLNEIFMYDSRHTLFIPHHLKSNWVIIPLTFKNKFCGVVGVENATLKTNDQFKQWIKPLIPITASNIIGFYQISQETSNSQDLFLSTISHEIRTPLNGIVGISRILKESLPLSDEQKSYISVISECTNQLLELINDILDFSKMGCDQLTLESEPFDLRSCVEEIHDLVFVNVQEKKISLHFDISKSVPHYIVGDKKRIRQILLNLVHNSIKFTDCGSITIKIYNIDDGDGVHGLQTKHTASNYHKKSPPIIHFEIEDTGSGIPLDQQKNIFKSFYQVKVQQPRCEGVGLGLAICKKLCQLMGGDINIKHSVVGKGTCVYFYIPFIPPSENFKLKKEKELIMISLKDKHILLLDPQKERRLKILHELIKAEMKPFTCSNIEECKTYMNHVFFDLALADESPEFVQLVKEGQIPLCLLEKDDGLKKEWDTVTENNGPIILSNNDIFNETQSGYVIIKSLIETLKLNSTPGNIPCTQPLDILVVEDNSHNMFLVIEILKKLGYKNIDTAKSGPEAIQKAVCKVYDVILMDLLIPSIDGISAGIQILNYHKGRCPKNLKRTLDKYESLLPTIVAVTAMLTNETQTKCKQAGFNAFLSKPLNQDELEIMLNIIAKRRYQSRKSLQGKI